MMTTHYFEVSDQDGVITLNNQDLLKYTGPANVIAAALMTRLCKHAFALLSPDEPVMRRKLYWTLGFPGPGIVDCVEMISMAVREGRCLQKPMFNHPDAPMSIGGQFVFDIHYSDRALRIWPSADIFDDEFRQQVSKWQEADHTHERQHYLQYKQAKVEKILSEPESRLFNTQWIK